MSTFSVKINRILSIDPHPNADLIELAKIKGYDVIVGKNQFNVGDLVVYIPEGSIVPEWLISTLGLTGKLAGPKHNRVKAVRLRGILSQGLVYSADQNTLIGEHTTLAVNEDDDVAEFLGVVKHVPQIPINMAGEVFNAFGFTSKYDIENIKNYPDVLQNGEDVVATEKIHGTFITMGYVPELAVADNELVDGTMLVGSKGVSDSGLAFKGNDNNANNLYVMAARATADKDGFNLIERAIRRQVFPQGTPFYFMGEVYGPVQDLKYGLTTPRTRFFDVYVGLYGKGMFLNYQEMLQLSIILQFETVPELYNGPYSNAVVDQYTTGVESVSGTGANIREGIVIKPTKERTQLELGRVVLKSVSADYLTRKRKAGQEPTEYN